MHVRLTFWNCLSFNTAGSPISKLASKLLAIFEKVLAVHVMTTNPKVRMPHQPD